LEDSPQNRPQQSVKLRTGHIRAARDNKNVSSAPLSRGKGRISADSSCQAGQIFSILCAYENDNSPIKKFNEPLAFARVPSHYAHARLLCAFAKSASG
jgi:hypothetical protein